MTYRSPLLNVMTGAALKAAKGLIRDFGELEQLQVSKKGPADFVSKADRRAEEVLRAELHKARPSYGLLMEESGTHGGSDTSNRWIVDPLDGTTNFLHGIPHFSISIGLERDGELFAGVIYSPIVDEMYVAERGSGAFLNGRRLRVSGRRSVEEALFATGIPFKGQEGHELFMRQLAHGDGGLLRRAPLRLGRARSGLGRRRPLRRLSGRTGSSRGTSPPASSWCAKPAASSPIWPAGARCSPAAACSPATPSSTATSRS